MSEEEVPGAVAGSPDEETDELTPGYKAPKQVDLKTIQDLDADDEALVKYKQTLLGKTDEVLDEGGNNVVLKQLVYSPLEGDQKELDLTGDLSKLKDTPIEVKEGTQYRMKVMFRVQREIVSGLRYKQVTYRKGIKVDNSNHMVGSYGPKSEVQEFRTPVDDAPSGLISRGSYKVKSTFTDDDKNIYLEWEWALKITK